jgi:hypothetical protein
MEKFGIKMTKMVKIANCEAHHYFAFIKPTPNASFFTHQATLLDKYSRAPCYEFLCSRLLKYIKGEYEFVHKNCPPSVL